MRKNEKRIEREANRLESNGWPFLAKMLRDGVDNGDARGAIERAAKILERAQNDRDVKRLRELVS